MINDFYYKLGAQPSAIRELFAYGLQRKSEVGNENVYDFSLGSPNVPSPPQVAECLKKLVQIEPCELHAYSMGNGLPSARGKIAASISREFDFKATGDNVYITSGAAGALCATLKAVVHSDEELILVTPCFPEYFMWASEIGCKVAQATADKNTFQLDIGSIKDAITDKTAAIIINSPNNPTGVVYTEQSLKELAALLNEAQKKFNKQIYIIADEPYRKLTYGKTVAFIPAIYNNTIVCDSASKSLSMPGERIGYVYVSDTADKAREIYLAVSGAARALGHVCASVLFQRLYAECFDLGPDIEAYSENRKLITQKLDEIGFEYANPDGAFYLWIKSPLESAKEFSELAKSFDILLVPSDSFGCNGWVRLGFCVAKNTITNSFKAWDKLAAAVQKLHN